MASISSEGGERNPYQPLEAGVPSDTTAAACDGSGGSLADAPPESDAEIDAYMARLLERVNQKPSRSSPAPAAAAPPAVAPPTPPADPLHTDRGDDAVAAEHQPPSDQKTDDGPNELAGAEPQAETSPRVRTAPSEQPRDLAAMRDLANSSAHVAIEIYSSKRLRREARNKLLVAVPVGVAAVLLMRLTGDSLLLRAQSLIAATVGAVYGCQAIGLWWRARTAGRKACDWPETEAEAPPPAADGE